MNSRRRTNQHPGLLAVLAVGVSLSCAVKGVHATDAAPGVYQFRTESVFLVVIDGVRYSESFGAEKPDLIPNMARELAPQGVVNTRFSNSGHTRTVSGHAMLVTGTRQRLTNAYHSKSRPTRPTIFEYWRHQRKAPKESVLVASSKRKLTGLAYSKSTDYGRDYRANTEAADALDLPVFRMMSPGYRKDRRTIDKLFEAMAEDHPQLVLVNLRETDTRAHAGDWDGYLAALVVADELVAKLWRQIQADPFYAGRTTMIVTNDHGRHLDSHGGFEEHGDSCAGCRHIQFLALGPDFEPGLTVDTPRDLIDVVPTVALMLGLDVPNVEGQVMSELFRRPQHGVAPTSKRPGERVVAPPVQILPDVETDAELR